MATQTNLEVRNKSRNLQTGAAQRRCTSYAADNSQTISRSQLRWLSLFLLYAMTCMGFVASAKAQTFQTIKPLVFTKAYKGADSLSQVFTVASTGDEFDFYLSVVNGTGGNWLTTNLSTGEYGMPTTVTVAANPDITLAAGTYTAQIMLKSSGGSITETIPVSLIIKPTSSAFFDDLPGALTFSMVTKGSIIPTETIPIRNAGSSSLSFTVSATTYNSGGWITLSETSGTAPSMLNVGINVSKLPGQGLTAGFFTGQVVLQTSGDTVTIPVSVTVGDSVFEQVNPLSFSKVYKGADSLSQVFTVASTGDEFDFYLSVVNGTGGNWLTTNLSTGEYGMPTTVTVSANPDITLVAGTYTAEIIVRSSGGSLSSVIPVTLTIQPTTVSSFDELPGELTFSMVTKGTAPPPEVVQIRNVGSGTLNFTASSSTSDGSSWITLSSTSGTAPYLLNVGINVSKLPGQGLTAGFFTGQVVLQTSGDTVTIPVSVTVGDSVFEQVNPLSFSKVYKGADSLSQVFTVASTGDEFDFYLSVVNGTGGNWLTTNLSTGEYGMPTTVTVAANPDITLAAGTYTAEIIVRSSGGSLSSVIPVTLTIQPTTVSSFDELPGELTFSGQATGAALSSKPLPIRNAGPGTLNWAATASTADGGKWITLSAASGTAPSTPTVSINVSKLPGKGLTAGFFIGQVVLQTATGMVTVPVAVTLGDSVFVPLPAFNFTKPYQATNPSTQTFNVTSTDSNFDFYLSVVNGTGGNWLRTNLSTGEYGMPTTVTVAANPDINLAAGVYTSEIIIRSSGGSLSMVIPVTLTITSSTATATPKFTPPGGSYSTTQSVSIASSTIDSAIYYTLDGTTPTTASPRYSSPIQVSATETIKALAIAPGFPQSAVATAVYTFTTPSAATPAATITISEATTGVTVYYTTNGTTPTTSSTKYTAPIALPASGTLTLKFIAIGTGYSSSVVRTITTSVP